MSDHVPPSDEELAAWYDYASATGRGNMLTLITEVRRLKALQCHHGWRAKSAASQARSEEISALNRLNAAQKAVDAWYADLKKAADRETDWRREK